MGVLNALKLVAAQQRQSLSAVQIRRDKLVSRLTEQIDLARATQTGTRFTATRTRTITDTETGLRRQVEAAKRVKPWWFKAENGKVVLSVRYGSRVLELAKGKSAVEVGSDKDLVLVLGTIREAVLAGELDAQMEAAANKLREGFSE